MEIINKLLKGTKEDVLIGLEFLLQKQEQEIVNFFIKYGAKPRTMSKGYIDFDTTLNASHDIYYIQISNTWTLLISEGIRLRDIHSQGFSPGNKIISKENYLNGMY